MSMRNPSAKSPATKPAASPPTLGGSAAAVTVTGTTAVGSVLTAAIAAGYGGTPAYQWVRGVSGASDLTGAVNISGATSSTYTVVSADEGRLLGCRVSGLIAPAASASGAVAVAPVVGIAPGIVTAPAITSTPTVGQTVGAQTYSVGVYSGTPAPVTALDSWLLDGSVVSTGYTFAAGDVGKGLQARMSVSNASGTIYPTTLSTAIRAAFVPIVTQNERVGFNIPQENYAGRCHMYVDILRAANGWGLPDGHYTDPASQGRGPIAVDADGWPLEDFQVACIFNGKTTPNLEGDYTIVFDGPPGVTIQGLQHDFTVSAPTQDAATGKWVAIGAFTPNANPASDGGIQITMRNTQGQVKNLKIIRPGYDWRAHPTFTSHWLDYCKKHNTIRFMDWTLANFGHVLGDWATRSTPQMTRAGTWGLNGWHIAYPAQGARSWEEVVEMANAAECNLWVNIPVAADATYVQNLASLLSSTVNPSLKIYVEVGNELWNNMFGQTHAARLLLRDDVATWSASDRAALQYDYYNTTVPFDLQTTTGQANMMPRWVARKLRAHTAIFKSAFAANPSRILPVFAWQQGGLPFEGENVFRYLADAYPGEAPSSWLHAIAGAPYLHMGNPDGPGNAWLQNNLTPDQVLDELENWLPNLPSFYQYSKTFILALSNNVKWITYEAGVDTVGNASVVAKGESTRLPRMKTIQRAFIDQLQSYGCGIWMQYTGGAGATSGGGYTWPAEEYLTDVPHVVAPKQAALDEAAGSPWPALTTRLSVSDSPWDSAQFEENVWINQPASQQYQDTRGTWSQSNLTRTYFANVETAGNYTLSISTDSTFDPINVWSVTINGVLVADEVETPSGVVTTALFTGVPLEAGPAVIRITHHHAKEGGVARNSYGLTMTTITVAES